MREEVAMTNHTAGPDFVAFQVRDVEASARFYEEVVGLHRLPAPNPAAAVFSTGPGSSFAVRTPLPGVDLEAGTPLGYGVGVWFHQEDALAVHARLLAGGGEVVEGPLEGPFGTQFSFRDPDGYLVTLHSRA
jgi:predicted enzyme related to lactoylglutathione lyase